MFFPSFPQIIGHVIPIEKISLFKVVAIYIFCHVTYKLVDLNLKSFEVWVITLQKYYTLGVS